VGKAIRSVWIGPPVGRYAHVVVLIAAGRGELFMHDRIGAAAKGAIRVGLETTECGQQSRVVIADSLPGSKQFVGMQYKYAGLKIVCRCREGRIDSGVRREERADT